MFILGGRQLPKSIRIHLLRSYVKTPVSDLRSGDCISYNGKPYVITSITSNQLGRGSRSFLFALKDPTTNSQTSLKPSPKDSFEKLIMRDRPFQFLYKDDSDLHLIDPKSLEQVSLPLSLKSSDAITWLLESGAEVKVRYCEDAPVSIIPPKSVKCTVNSIGFVHDSGDSRKFTIITEAGGRVVVPLRVEPGDQILVNTDDFSYHGKP